MKEEILKKLFEYVSSLEIVAREQIPDVLNQVLVKGIITSILLCVFSSIAFINLYISIKVFKTYKNENIYDEKEFFTAIYLFVSILIAIGGVFGMLYGIENILTIIYAPKAYLLGVLK